MLVLSVLGFIAGFFADPWPWAPLVVAAITVPPVVSKWRKVRRREEEYLVSGFTPLMPILAIGVIGNLALTLIPMAAAWALRTYAF